MILKVRAWDNERGVLAPVTNIGWDDNLIKVESYDYCLPLDKTPIEQYTGLKDRNGVEIYEGDIVRGIDGYMYQVYFDETLAGYAGYNISEKAVGAPGNVYFAGGEVIGNIHENPELLEGK